MAPWLAREPWPGSVQWNVRARRASSSEVNTGTAPKNVPPGIVLFVYQRFKRQVVQFVVGNQDQPFALLSASLQRGSSPGIGTNGPDRDCWNSVRTAGLGQAFFTRSIEKKLAVDRHLNKFKPPGSDLGKPSLKPGEKDGKR